MQKFILIALMTIYGSNLLYAQDVITSQNGEEISARISKKPRHTYKSRQFQSNIPKYQPYAVGIEACFGSMKERGMDTDFGMDLGVRLTRNFTTHLGWDVAKLKYSTYLYPFNKEPFSDSFDFSLLSGIRISTPRFGRNKTHHGFSAFRLGLSYYEKNYTDWDYYNNRWRDKTDNGLSGSLEWDLGIHFRSTFLYSRFSLVEKKSFFGFGVGLNFGKLVEIEKKQEINR